MIKIREAKKSDLKQIKEMNWKFLEFYVENRFDKLIVKNHRSRNWGRKFVSRTFRNKKWKYFVAEKKNRLVGFISGKIDKYPPIFKENRFGYIWVVYIEKEFRGEGIGKKLIKEFIKWLKRKNIHTVENIIAHSNIISKKIFNSLGFIELEKRYRLKI